MKVPFTWRPTGWFMIGWSSEFPQGTVKPLKYFGQDLVAYRTEEGSLHVLDAHCPHLGAHIGHGGKVNGDCVECPYHGWGYGPDGVNRYIPYEDRPNVSKKLRSWPVDGPFYRTVAGWPLPTAKSPDGMAMKINGISCGVGGSYAIFEGSVHYRLAFFTTPIDDETSDLFYSIWWPRDEGDDSPTVPDHYRERAEKEFLSTLWDDLEIWRYQVYVEKPVLAQQDARPYGALRKWAKQFYEVA